MFLAGYAQFGKLVAGSSEETTDGGAWLNPSLGIDFNRSLVTTDAPTVQAPVDSSVRRFVGEEFPDDALATAPPAPPSASHANDALEVSMPHIPMCLALIVRRGETSSLRGARVNLSRRVYL